MPNFRIYLLKQSSFSDAEFAHKKKQTRRDRFRAEIEAVTPSAALVGALLPYYPKGDGRGRPPVGLGRMLRMYIAQQCFALSDEGIEDTIYDSRAIKRPTTRYRGLAKNNAQLFRLFGFANLVLARRFLGRMHTQVAS